MKTANELLTFIENSPSCFHVIANFRAMLAEAGYTELRETEAWQLAAGGKHIGLWNVRERLAAVCGGHMEIESGIDKGTNVTMCIPKYRKESE